MRFHKITSTILHPIVIPTIGVLLYFIFIQSSFNRSQRFAVLGLIFVTTYLIPLFILILFKKIKLIKSFNVESIKERKIPVAVMIVLFYLLGNTLHSITNLSDLGLLFYATSLGLVFIYLSFFLKLKASLHLLSLGISTGFFMVLGLLYSSSFVPIVIIAILLSGLLGSSRLYLKAHTVKEIYIGYFYGFISPFIVYYFL
ncbi:MAG: hypothetical protein AB8B78_11530 [Polaribacter sp.]